MTKRPAPTGSAAKAGSTRHEPDRGAHVIDPWLAYYLAIGVVVGFFAGMLGIGGGAITVPMLVYGFKQKGYPLDVVLHLALGVSMASIVFTSLASLRAHHRHGAVDWRVVRRMTPGLIVGGFFGTWLARYIPPVPLALIFSAFVFYVATTMLFHTPKPKPGATNPSHAVMFAAGFGICTISALAAVGGAAMTIPFLVYYGIAFHTALGTAAAVGFPLALSGTVGYVINGWSTPGLPPGSLGYVYLPALAAMTVGTVAMAPFGARFAHRSSVKTLKRVFAVTMYGFAGKMIYDLWRATA